MVKVLTKGAAPSQNDTKKNRKKQAKREAKMMLLLELARADVKRAEQKLAKAQSRLEEQREQVRKLETQLAQMRSQQSTDMSAPSQGLNHQQERVGAEADVQWHETTTSDNENTYAHETPRAQEVPLPPAEGRSDVGEGPAASEVVEPSSEGQ